MVLAQVIIYTAMYISFLLYQYYTILRDNESLLSIVGSSVTLLFFLVSYWLAWARFSWLQLYLASFQSLVISVSTAQKCAHNFNYESVDVFFVMFIILMTLG